LSVNGTRCGECAFVQIRQRKEDKMLGWAGSRERLKKGCNGQRVCRS
jgi:hypothetical protein